MLRRRVGETIAWDWAVVWAMVLSGCSHPAQDESVDASATSGTGEDTDAVPAECPKSGLILYEGYSARVSSSVMFPESMGGANYVTGSCGGEGIDAAYLVTSQKTSWYNLSLSAQSLGAPTFHIHAGDSCHGPELYCGTGSHHSFKLMLAEGESVTLVVDTEPDLEIPETGLRYSVGISWGAPPPEPCHPEEFHACNETSVGTFESCMAAASCENASQSMCIAEFVEGLESCTEEFCPDGPEDAVIDGPSVCAGVRGTCGNTDGCDANTCEYQWQACMDACRACNSADFDFEYASACELTMPGPPSFWHAPFVSVDIADQKFAVSEPGLACGDPEATDVVWATDSSLLLCEPACEAFAMAGSADVTYGSPPCH